MGDGLWSVVCGLLSVVGGLWLVVHRFFGCSGNVPITCSGEVLASLWRFFCVIDWNVSRTAHENTAGTSSRGGGQTVFLASVALITSGKVACRPLLVVCGWWSVVCVWGSGVSGRW